MSEAAGISAGGGLLGGAISAGASAAAANKAWERQKKVLKNQIQWRTNDLRKAGLNPILAAGSPLGASAPSVAMAKIPDLSGIATNAVRAGASERDSRTKKTLSGSQANALDTQAGKNEQETRTSAAQQAVFEENKGLVAANARNAELQNELLELRKPEADAMAEAWLNPTTRRALQLRNILGGGITGATGALVGGAFSVGESAGRRLRRDFKESEARRLHRKGQRIPFQNGLPSTRPNDRYEYRRQNRNPSLR